MSGHRIMVDLKPNTYRGEEWAVYALHVLRHIEQYTVPQYGDGPSDPVQKWTLEDCKRSLERYVNRMCRGQRGKDEAMRDMLKVGHYGCIAHAKMMEDE